MKVPVPSELRKSPPCIMKSLIYRAFISTVSPKESSSSVLPMQSSMQQVSRNEPTYNTVEFGGFVAHWSALCVLVFTRTELAEVLGCFWDSVTEELHLYAAKGLS